MPQLVFLSLFFGLVTGKQSVVLQVQPGVALVRVELGGREVARMTGAPWSATVDFGSDLIPNQLAAIAYDDHGQEIGRIAQTINLAQPSAEVQMVIHTDGARPVAVDLVGRHRLRSAPSNARLLVDGVAVPLNRGFHASLPSMSATQPHILSAEMHFSDGEVAHRDVAIQAGFSGSTNSELAPLLVRVKSGTQSDSLTDCFFSHGAPLRATAIEKTDAVVVMVKDPASRIRARDAGELPFALRTEGRILWPVPRPINMPGEPTAIAFPQSIDHSRVPSAGWLLQQRLSPVPSATEPRQFTDAVAVAAIGSLERARRRAVVLVLGKTEDHSLYTPAVVRRYLDEIGVPLFVWSADLWQPREDPRWGQVDNISTSSGIRAAVARVEHELELQRIVWIAADPLTTLRAEGSERCGLVPLAHRRAAPSAQ